MTCTEPGLPSHDSLVILVQNFFEELRQVVPDQPCALAAAGGK